MWKVFVTVLAVQLVCTLQAPMENGGEMLLKMMMQRMMKGGEESKSREMEGKDDIKSMIKEYMEERGIGEDDEPGPEMLKFYTQMMQKDISYYKHVMAGDLVLKSLIKSLVEDPEGPGDFEKNLVLNSIHSMVEPADDKKKIMAKIFEYLMANPHGEQSEMAKMLLKRLTSRLNGMDKGVLRALMLHYMFESRGEKLEVLRQLMDFLMSDDLAEDMTSIEMLQLLIQQYAYAYEGPEEKRTMALFILGSLADRKDKEGKAILRYIVKKSLMATNADMAEEHQAFFFPPGPCRVERTDGTELASSECPHDMECNVGPVTYRFNNNNLRFTMCGYPSTFFTFHACQVAYPGGESDTRNNCGESSCDFGPFTLTADEGNYGVTFCSDYANYTVNVSTWDPLLLRACALEDYSGFRSLQRRCPWGMRCGGPRLPVRYENYTLSGYLCHHDEAPNQEKGKESFMEQILGALLGFWEDEEDDDEDSMEMGGAMAEGEMNGDFLQYIIRKLLADGREDEMEDQEEDRDIKPFKVMAYLVEKMADNNEVLSEFVESFKTKHYMGIVTNADRVFMHGIIRHLLAIWFKEERGEGRGEGDIEDLLKWMMYIKKKMYENGGEREDRSEEFMMKIREMMMEKHAEHHEELEEKIGKIYKMIKEKKEESREDDRDEEMEYIKKIFEKLMSMKKD